MSPWKVHIESFNIVKEEAASATRSVDDLKSELEHLKQRLNHEETSRKESDARCDELNEELAQTCTAMMYTMVRERPLLLLLVIATF